MFFVLIKNGYSKLFRLQDRKGDDYCLAPTHEEAITEIVRYLHCDIDLNYCTPSKSSGILNSFLYFYY